MDKDLQAPPPSPALSSNSVTHGTAENEERLQSITNTTSGRVSPTSPVELGVEGDAGREPEADMAPQLPDSPVRDYGEKERLRTSQVSIEVEQQSSAPNTERAPKAVDKVSAAPPPSREVSFTQEQPHQTPHLPPIMIITSQVKQQEFDENGRVVEEASEILVRETPERDPPRPVEKLSKHIEDGTFPPPPSPGTSQLSAELPQEGDEGLATYLVTPLLPLPATAAPIMSGVTQDATREPDEKRTRVHAYQRYLVANRCRDIFKTTYVHAPQPASVTDASPAVPLQEEYLKRCNVVLEVDKEFDEPQSYELRTPDNVEPLLRVELSGMDRVWNVRNGTMFSDVERDIVVGKVHHISSLDVANSFFAFVPVKGVLFGVPRLEMHPERTEELGKYWLSVAGVGKHVGSVTVLRYYFDIELRFCTREEAIVWLAMLVAAELEDKTGLEQYRTT